MKLYCKIKRLLALDVESSTTQAPLIQREMCNLASVLVQWCRVYGTAGGATIFKQYMLNSNQRKIKSYKKAGVYCSKFSRFLRTPSEYIPVSAQDWCSPGNIFKTRGKLLAILPWRYTSYHTLSTHHVTFIHVDLLWIRIADQTSDIQDLVNDLENAFMQNFPVPFPFFTRVSDLFLASEVWYRGVGK